MLLFTQKPTFTPTVDLIHIAVFTATLGTLDISQTAVAVC